MPELKVDDLLQEVSADQPCGENLEYDPDFIALDEAARDKAAPMLGEGSAEAVDWAAVEEQATSLFARTKDLRVALHLARAALNLRGLPGFLESLRLIHGCLDRYWEPVHPQLDPADDLDPTVRLNILEGLSNPDTFLHDLKASRLVVSPTFGPVSYREVAIANGEISPTGEDDSGALGAAEINAAFLECDLEELRLAAEAGGALVQIVEDIEAKVAEQVGAQNAPNFESLRASLLPIRGLLAEKLSARGGDDGAREAAAAGEADQGPDVPTAPAAGPIGVVKTRQDVVRLLDMICEYYARNEPSSPVPLLLKRAKGLVAKEFIDILRDLVPDAVGEAERIRGSEGTDGSQ
ncbi:MAG: type VI secretion system protein TssA [Kiloniellales bacterium]|nr:type VI secretion system protein TssA [Kiloniellales bacterium]